MATVQKSRASKVVTLGSANIKELRELVERDAELGVEIKEAQAARKLIAERLLAVANSTGENAFDALDPAEARAGTQTIVFKSHDADGTEYRLTGEVKKTVDWDSKALLAAAAALPWDTVQEIFKIEFSVPEKTWNAIKEGAFVTDDTRAAIAAARSVKYAPLAVKPA